MKVVSAVIIRDGKILLSQRRKDQQCPMTWESPGGKVEDSETDHQALLREMGEELGVKRIISADRPLWSGEVNGYSLTMYLVDIGDQLPISKEGQGLGWFSRVEMLCLNLTPANDQVRSIVYDHLYRVAIGEVSEHLG